MVKKSGFEERMLKFSDEELYNVLANEKDYVPEAIDAAKRELQSRNLSPERKMEIEKITEESANVVEEKTNKPLACWIRILMLLFPIRIPQVIVAESYRILGYKRRVKECWIWMGYGIIFYIVIILLKLM